MAFLASLGGLLVLGGGIAAFVLTRPAAARPDVLLHVVKKENLNVTVTEKGTLESAENKDVICKVRAGNKGFASTINWVIEDGSKVKAGDLLMILDDSALQDQAAAQRIAVKQAYANKVKAETDYEIAQGQNEDDVKVKRLAVELAEIELEKYTGVLADTTSKCLMTVAGGPAGVISAMIEGGAYKQELDDLTGQVRLAESDVEQNRERAAWADRMVKMKYMSPAQAQAERSRLDSSLEKLRSLQAKRDLLIFLDKKKMVTDLVSKLDSARRAYDLAIKVAHSKELQADAERASKGSIYLQELDKLKDIEDQIRECRIYAPQDGMVVYFKQESSRFGSTPQGLIEQGAQVKEGQKLLRIPNLDVMQVNTKVHEAMVGRVKGDVRVPTGLVENFRVGLFMNPDPFSRLVSQREDFIEHLKELYRTHEYTIASKGQKATVRVDAMPDMVLPARVRSVAAVASQTDSWVSDVKLYQTYVLIERRVEGLKPDMTAEVTIQVEGVHDVLAIPIQAVIGGAELGAKRKVYVKLAGGGYDQKEITLGLYNEKMIEVRDGLAEGDEVVINPKVLLGDTKTRTRDGDNGKAGPDGGGKGDWKAGEGGKGGDPSKKKGTGGGKGGGMPGGGGPGGPGGPGAGGGGPGAGAGAGAGGPGRGGAPQG